MAQPLSKKDVFIALAQKTAFEVVTEVETEKQLRISGRVHPSQWNFFVPVIYALIKAQNTPGNLWTCDISKQYIIHVNRILYSYRVIFQGEALAAQYASIVSTIRGAARPSRVEITEMLLPGSKPGDVRGGINAKGKGTAGADTTPMILSRKGR